MNFKLMNNFIKDYGILRIGLGIWGVSLFICVYQESEKQHGDSVLQVAVQENEEIFNKIREEGKMCEALVKLMEPEMKAALENNRKEMISQALNVGSSVEDISRVMGIPLAEVEAIAKEI